MYITVSGGDTSFEATGAEKFRVARLALLARQTYFHDVFPPLLERLERLPSIGHAVCSVWVTEHQIGSISLVLNKEHKDSPLAREIAQEFHTRGTKDMQWNGEALAVTFPPDETRSVAIEIRDYLPSTCRIEEVEEYVPAGTRKVHKVICTDEP